MTNKTVTMSRELAERILSDLGNAYISSRVGEELRAMLAAPAVERQESVAWANDQQLLLCSKSPREVQPNNPMMHDLPRNIAGSALKTDYCNTPLYTSPPAPVEVVLPEPCENCDGTGGVKVAGGSDSCPVCRGSGLIASPLPERSLEAAAKTLAACMDYPWEHMPEQGRASMREHAKAVINAATKELNQ
jgi:hypothetical protein